MGRGNKLPKIKKMYLLKIFTMYQIGLHEKIF